MTQQSDILKKMNTHYIRNIENTIILDRVDVSGLKLYLNWTITQDPTFAPTKPLANDHLFEACRKKKAPQQSAGPSV